MFLSSSPTLFCLSVSIDPLANVRNVVDVEPLLTVMSSQKNWIRSIPGCKFGSSRDNDDNTRDRKYDGLLKVAS